MTGLHSRLSASEALSAHLQAELEESQTEAAQLAEALRQMPGKQLELAAAYEERLAEERKIAEEAIHEFRLAAERIRGEAPIRNHNTTAARRQAGQRPLRAEGARDTCSACRMTHPSLFSGARSCRPGAAA